MQIESQTVPIPIAGPVMREDDLNAILAPSAPEPAGLTLTDILSESRRNVPWPSGGHVTRLHTLPWEGASARYFDFSLNDRLRVRLDPDRELLLTFFLEGHVSGHVGDEHGPELDFRLNRMLLRTPNRNGGYLIDIPGARTHRFVQFRLRRDLLPRWLKALGVRLPAAQLDEMVDRDDGRILCNAAITPQLQGCLERIRGERSDQPAFVPLFHARATELLLCALQGFDDLLRPARSPGADAAAVLARLRETIAEAPAHPWTITELARRVGCTSARLQQHVRDATGLSVYNLLVAQRLELAATLLRETRLGVQAIAAEAGWQCHSRFAAVFRAHYGSTPRAYRLRHRNSATRLS
ncbi:AraC family transcriptional regulator [Pigmentiphaga sp. GD03639]|uniref:helix-turn-helix domain-containing protein n=1 Tax=Pigmentiphaga sp. GD03639 TaxID=2975354 RepID=UPI00244BCA9B|nr:AraC family transcriptional regulator [Pigmentiphaga sp. GD03639]MDH2237216.1 AraC family transcriptional regulator [Pigmentiphaga sp. GD03639]